MVINMKANSEEENVMERVYVYFKMVPNLKGFGLMIYLIKVILLWKMVHVLKVILKKINSLVKERFNIKIQKYIKVNGDYLNNMVQVNIIIEMEQYIKDNLNSEKNLVMVLWHTQIMMNIKDNGKKIKNMVKEKCYIIMVQFKKVNG